MAGQLRGWNRRGRKTMNSGETRLVFPGLAGFYGSIQPYGYPIIRFAAGVIFIYHGYAKLFLGFGSFVAKTILTPMGFPIPDILVYFLAILELFGGAALALGFLTRPIALLFAIEMIFVVKWHYPNGYFFNYPKGGYEFPLLMLLTYIGIFFTGSGRCSIDRSVGKEV
jgi:putative oxidoreductase